MIILLIQYKVKIQKLINQFSTFLGCIIQEIGQICVDLIPGYTYN